ncbi:hypothetical protein D3C72_1989810 [compost metagenome]
MESTCPIEAPKASIGAPATRPLTDWSNRMRIRIGVPSGWARAALSEGKMTNVEFALAAACPRTPTESNATPPIMTESSDWDRTSRPRASTDKSTPLAFQKRVPSLT